MTHRKGKRVGREWGCETTNDCWSMRLGAGQGQQEWKALWDYVAPRFWKTLASRAVHLAQRDTDRVTVCGQPQSADWVTVPKWMPRKSTSCLCWACPHLPGRTVKWALRPDRNTWEVKDSTGSRCAQLCGGIWADTPIRPPPWEGESFPCEFQFLSKMKGVRTNELLGSFQHWNAKILLVSKTPWGKEMCCPWFSNLTFEQLLSHLNRNKHLLVKDSTHNRSTINM